MSTESSGQGSYLTCDMMNEAAMPKSVHITVPRPTFEEMTKHLRISRARKKELQVLVDHFKFQLSRSEEAPLTVTKPEKRRKSASAA